MIDLYPILALPFAAFLSWVTTRATKFKRLIWIFIGCCVALNLFQTMQAKYNIIHYDSMTMESYFRVFGTTSKKPDREKYLKHPDYQKALKGMEED